MPADPCKDVKCKFGAECGKDGHCLCPTDCPANLIEPVCVHSKISYISECEMRASACKQEMDIDPSSFIYGHCPNTVTTTAAPVPDDRTEGSGDDSDDDNDEDDDYNEPETGDDDAVEGKKRTDSQRGKSGDGNHKKTDADPESGIDDREEDQDDDLPHPGSNEKDAFRSKLCRNMICPIGALCKVRKESGGIRDEAYCDCRHMCDRVQQLSLATTWIKSSVCGSNGLLYSNECRLRQDSCNKNITIHIQPFGNCRSNASTLTSAEDNNNRPNDLLGEYLP
jgi:coxsackievirus/adenovirus receptor